MEEIVRAFNYVIERAGCSIGELPSAVRRRSRKRTVCITYKFAAPFGGSKQIKIATMDISRDTARDIATVLTF
jgi:hypothetical protein